MAPAHRPVRHPTQRNEQGGYPTEVAGQFAGRNETRAASVSRENSTVNMLRRFRPIKLHRRANRTTGWELLAFGCRLARRAGFCEITFRGLRPVGRAIPAR